MLSLLLLQFEYEDILDYSQFAVRVSQHMIYALPSILEEMVAKQYEKVSSGASMHSNAEATTGNHIWHMLPAATCKKQFKQYMLFCIAHSELCWHS